MNPKHKYTRHRYIYHDLEKGKLEIIAPTRAIAIEEIVRLTGTYPTVSKIYRLPKNCYF